MHAFLKMLFLSLVIIVSNVSAQEVDSVYKVDDIVSVLKLNKKGLLPYGFKPGAKMAEIKAGMVGTELFKEDSTFVTYTIYFSEDKYDFADITFELPDTGVTYVSIETYFGNKEPAMKALNLIKLNFDKLYRKGQYSDQALLWKFSKKEIKLKKKDIILQTAINLWIRLKEIEFEGDNGFVIDFFTEDPVNQE